jgi:transglutaminase-like putative cysteine protease
VCYELNTLACELLRRAGIPAAVAVGWTFDRGQLDEPDHLWAVALLPTPEGPRWMPVDASTTRAGTPLHAGRRPPGPWRARPPRRQAPPPRTPAWMQAPARQWERGDAVPLADLVRVARYLEALAGRGPDSAGSADSADELRRRCRELLRDPERAAALLRAIRGER